MINLNNYKELILIIVTISITLISKFNGVFKNTN